MFELWTMTREGHWSCLNGYWGCLNENYPENSYVGLMERGITLIEDPCTEVWDFEIVYHDTQYGVYRQLYLHSRDR